MPYDSPWITLPGAMSPDECGPQPSAWAEASVVVEGALNELARFTDEALMQDWARQRISECEAKHLEARVYVLYHDHKPDVDCECVQYLTDHQPYLTTAQEEG